MIQELYKDGVLNVIFSDLERICEPTLQNLFKLMLFPSGNMIRYVVFFRITQWARIGKVRKVVVFPIVYLFLRHYEFKYGIHASTRMYIGRGLQIVHGDGVYLNCNSIGNNFTCFQGVTFGIHRNGIPTVKNGVTVYPNAVIVGGIMIEDECVIGAQSYIDKDVDAKKIIYQR